MDEKKYAILAISESWLNSTVKNAEVEIDEYSLSRLERPRNIKNEFGGGVCVYMRKTLKTKVLKDLSGISDTGFHQLWMQVQQRSSHSCCASLKNLLIVILPALKTSGTVMRKRLFMAYLF